MPMMGTGNHGRVNEALTMIQHASVRMMGKRVTDENLAEAKKDMARGIRLLQSSVVKTLYDLESRIEKLEVGAKRPAAAPGASEARAPRSAGGPSRR